MSGDSYTVSDLVKELKGAVHQLEDDRAIQELIAEMQGLRTVAEEAVHHDDSERAKNVVESVELGVQRLEEVPGHRTKAAEAIADYLTERFPKAVEATPGSAPDGPNTPDADSSPHAKRRAARRVLWTFVDLGFAAAGTALMFAGGPLALSVGAVVIIGNYLWSAHKVTVTHQEARAQRRGVIRASGRAYLDTGLAVGDALLELVPGSQPVRLVLKAAVATLIIMDTFRATHEYIEERREETDGQIR